VDQSNDVQLLVARYVERADENSMDMTEENVLQLIVMIFVYVVPRVLTYPKPLQDAIARSLYSSLSRDSTIKSVVKMLLEYEVSGEHGSLLADIKKSSVKTLCQSLHYDSLLASMGSAVVDHSSLAGVVAQLGLFSRSAAPVGNAERLNTDSCGL
jgi:hypothetical protein